MKFTVESIKGLRLPPNKDEAIYFDDEVPGFGIRLRQGGSRRWIFQYKIGAKARRMSLGSADAITLKAAREGERDKAGKIIRPGARDLYAKTRLGDDPAGEKHEKQDRAGDTFEPAARRFLAFQKAHGGKGQGMRPRSYDDIERHLMVHAKPLHGLLLPKIQRQDIASVLSVVRSRAAGGKGAAVTANRVRSTLSSFFSWAISEGLVDHNPVTGTLRTEEQSRERVLTHDELRIIWNALEDDHFGAIMKLLMLTGQRAAEISGLRRSELQDDAFTLPPERTKNGKEHTVPLSAPARAIIAAQPIRQGTDGKVRDFIFGYADGPFSGWTGSRNLLNARIAKLTGQTLPHWTPHDLRRSFVTHASKLGIQPHVIEAIVNHVSGFRAGVAGIYNRNPYDAEKRTALATWADHLLSIVEGRDSNITTLRRA
jgi:integrase